MQNSIWELNIGSGNGLVPSGNKPLPETVFHDTMSGVTKSQWVNSLLPSDTIWRQTSGSALAQEMACYLIAPGYYLNQCWLLISDILWHLLENKLLFCIMCWKIILQNFRHISPGWGLDKILSRYILLDRYKISGRRLEILVRSEHSSPGGSDGKRWADMSQIERD